MKRTLTIIVVALFFVATVRAQDTSSSDVRAVTAKRMANVMAEATRNEDYATVITHTYIPLVESLGGREKAIETTRATIEQLRGKGIRINQMRIGEPGRFLIEGDKTFVVLPTTVTMTAPVGTIETKSYLLGISGDKGKTWKFLDGAGMENPTLREKILPPLPEDLELPSRVEPRVVKPAG